jgi:hypothetical protein
LHDIHTKFHYDWFRHSNNIKIINTTISKAAIPVLLMGGIYKVNHCVGPKWYDTPTKFRGSKVVGGGGLHIKRQRAR